MLTITWKGNKKVIFDEIICVVWKSSGTVILEDLEKTTRRFSKSKEKMECQRLDEL